MVVTVFSKHASLDVQLFRFNLTGMCRSACVGMCAGAHVCLHNDHSPMPQLLGALSVPAVIPCWGTAHTHTRYTYALTCHTLSVSTFNSQRCASVSFCVAEWCASASRRVCVVTRSCVISVFAPLWWPLFTSHPISGPLDSQRYSDYKPKRSFYWLAPKGQGTLCSIKCI